MCEDCGGPITGTVAEHAALAAGLRVCINCLDAMEEEAEAYDEMMREGGRECVFDPHTGRFTLRRIGA